MNEFLTTINGFDFSLIMIIIIGAIYHKSNKTSMRHEIELWKSAAIEVQKKYNKEYLSSKIKNGLDRMIGNGVNDESVI